MLLQKERLYEKALWRLQRPDNENNQLLKKEITPLTDEETEFYEKQKVCHICKKEFSTDKNDRNKNYAMKSEIIVITKKNLEELFIIFAI